ncbi:MAG: D-isomer specific 2-hydroxyacid dehydrogenase family protein [Lachnospiraceae bacterium]|nr:D-isomer specific 2-hydroxyacid dehydrogenase family protein [Lachnospiraceae bacterium]
MKIIVYEARPDEYQDLHDQAAQLDIQLDITDEIPSLDNSSRALGCDGVSILGQGKIDRELLDVYQKSGVRYISTRTIGYNHIDIAYAEKIGIRVCNACYPPNGVADFTVMMMLMCLRHYKQALWRGQVNDFSLTGLQGREMKDLTVGIIGTGKIGGQVIQNLSGFGCRMLAYDHRENPSAAKLAEYVTMDRLLTESDIISLHVPLLESNRHMINRETIRKMKDGVILINCSRGELADMEALIEGIENEKIGALGIDTSEGEEGIIHEDHRTDILSNRNWFYLHQFRNVIMTQHMAFYTDSAVAHMVACGIRGIYEMAHDLPCKTEVTAGRS